MKTVIIDSLERPISQVYKFILIYYFDAPCKKMLRGAYSVAPGRTYARFGFRRNTLL
jgi:hypothetical protein